MDSASRIATKASSVGRHLARPRPALWTPPVIRCIVRKDDPSSRTWLLPYRETHARRTPTNEPTDDELPALIEALLFVADAPIPEGAFARTLGVSPARCAERSMRYWTITTGAAFACSAGQGVQLVTAPEAAAAVEHFLGLESARRLSMSALETLAVDWSSVSGVPMGLDALAAMASRALPGTLRACEQSGHLPRLAELAELLGLAEGMQRAAGRPGFGRAGSARAVAARGRDWRGRSGQASL